VFLGMLVQRHIDRRKKAEEETAQANLLAAQLERELGALRDVNAQLGDKVVNTETTMFILLGHLKALSTFDRDALDRAVLQVMVEILHVEAASVWELADGRPQLRVTVGEASFTQFQLDPAVEQHFDPYDVLELQKVPRDVRGEHHLPFLLGRVRAGAGGPLCGYLAIDKLPLNSAPEATRLFAQLVDWFSIVVGNALEHERLSLSTTSVRGRR
jgi:hypothetical protein